jgi:hypothetical protein
MLWNAADLGMTLRYRAAEAGAKAMDISVQALGVSESDDFDRAFAAMNRQHARRDPDGRGCADQPEPQAGF